MKEAKEAARERERRDADAMQKQKMEDLKLQQMQMKTQDMELQNAANQLPGGALEDPGALSMEDFDPGATRYPGLSEAFRSSRRSPKEWKDMGFEFYAKPEKSVELGPEGQPKPYPTTPGQIALDKSYAKDYLSWRTSGGFADVQKNSQQLEEALDTLEGSTTPLTGPVEGLVPDMVKPFSKWGKKSLAVVEAVREVVQRNLRIVLGAQFTAKEGQQLMDRAFNEQLSPAENSKRVRRLMNAITGAAKAKELAAQHWDKYGTITGLDFPKVSFASLNSEIDAMNAEAGLGTDIMSDQDNQKLDLAQKILNDPEADEKEKAWASMVIGQ